MKKIVLILLSTFNYLVACDTEYEACKVGCVVAAVTTLGLSEPWCTDDCNIRLQNCRASNQPQPTNPSPQPTDSIFGPCVADLGGVACPGGNWSNNCDIGDIEISSDKLTLTIKCKDQNGKKTTNYPTLDRFRANRNITWSNINGVITEN